jgi:Flp pilus assembly pilin Flp
MQACRESTAALKSTVERFVADERGATAIEYAIVAAGVGCVVSGTVWNVGGTVKSTFYDKLAAQFP